MFEERIAALNQQHYQESLTASAVQNEKMIYTVDEIQDILGIGRSSAYNLVKQKAFPSVRIGRAIRIPVKPFHDWLELQS